MSITLSVVVQTICDRILAEAGRLNRLDGVAGDGDLGVTMSAAARAASEIAPKLDDEPLDVGLRQLGTAIAKRAPSTGGTLIATGLLAMARVPLTDSENVVQGTALRLAAAQEAIESRGGARPGEKTLLDALVPAIEALRIEASRGKALPDAMTSAAAAAREGAEKTREMRAQVGRAGWLADRSEDSPDAGAVLIAAMLEAARDALGAATQGTN